MSTISFYLFARKTVMEGIFLYFYTNQVQTRHLYGCSVIQMKLVID